MRIAIQSDSISEQINGDWIVFSIGLLVEDCGRRGFCEIRKSVMCQSPEKSADLENGIAFGVVAGSNLLTTQLFVYSQKHPNRRRVRWKE